MPGRGYPLFGALLALSIPPALCPQASQPAAPDTIQIQSSEVLVDAIVTDRHNRIVPDLKAEDFVVYEDGVPQKITSFALHRGAPPAAPENASPSAAPGQKAPPLPAPAEPPALTIVLLDYSTVEFRNQTLVRDACARYVREKLRPNELMAVFALGSSLHFLTDFTSDRDTLLAALKTGDLRGTVLASERADLNEGIGQGQGISSGVPTTNVGSGPAAASAGAGMTSAGSAAAQAMAAQRIAAQYAALRSAQDREQSRALLTAIRAIALGTKQIQGRKSLLLFSQGFVVPQILWPELYRTVDAANRAQLAVYAIDARGLEAGSVSGNLVPRDEFTAALGPSENEHNPLAQQDRIRATGGENMFDRVSQVGHDLQESALRYVANATGGLLIYHTNDLALGLERVSEEMRTYYLLSYRPANQAFDGKFRQVRVEVRVPKLNVRARGGYYAIPAGFDLLSAAEYQIVAESRDARAEDRIPLYLRAGAFRDSGQEYRVPVILEIPTAAVTFEKSGAGEQARFEILGLVRDARNNPVMRFGGNTEFKATDAEYEALKPGNLSFINTLSLPAGGAYSFEVVVKDLASGKVARQESGLYLPEPQPQLGVSTILLARDVEKAARPGNQFLSVGGAKILPSARCQFHNGDKLIFYFDVYNPQVGTDRKTALSVEVSVLQGGRRVNLNWPPYHLSQSVSGGLPHVTVARYIQLAGLSAGDYSLAVKVRDALGGQSQTAHASFTVVN